jgi:hypothetical protein
VIGGDIDLNFDHLAHLILLDNDPVGIPAARGLMITCRSFIGISTNTTLPFMINPLILKFDRNLVNMGHECFAGESA